MFKNGEELMDRYLEYCEWAAEQAFPVDKAFSTKRGIQHTSERRTGPKTLEGFQLFIPVVHKTFQQWERDRPDLTEAISLIRADIKDHKMRGAAAGVYSASIVGRELGLIDRASVEASFEPPVKRDKVNAEHHAIHVHPNDPDPLDLPRPLYSRAQLEAGIPFIPPDPKGG
ncbi:MAG: terminase small subunit [Roseovarius sp.]|nr:terminase small subunit [Roseovarius sp.]